MSNVALARDDAGPLEAYCCTGTSPGVGGCVSARLTLDRQVSDVQVTYEVHGPAHAPAIVVLGGISAGRHIAPTPSDPSPGWWSPVVSPGGALDPTRNRLIGIDFLGGPASEYRPGGPVTSHDQARAVAAVLQELGIARVSIVGASYGGMVALAFAELFPQRVARIVVLCAAHRTHPMATAWRSIQREAVRLGVDGGAPARGLSLARRLAMTTYRSAEEFEQRFDSEPAAAAVAARFPVEDYLEARGEAFARAFDARGFLALSESIDLHRVDPSAVRARATLVSVDSDALVPPWLVDELSRGAPDVDRHIRLRSPFGHDAFLKEVDGVSDAIRTAVAGPEVVT